MITQLQIENFKSWRDTGFIKMAPLTGFFGTNSSGKTGILQLLLLLKQTTEVTDQQRILYMGDSRSYVNLGTFYDIIHKHQLPSELCFSITWQLTKPSEMSNPALSSFGELNFRATIEGENDSIQVKNFFYSFNYDGETHGLGMKKSSKKDRYELSTEGYILQNSLSGEKEFPPPVKNYNFPQEVYAYFHPSNLIALPYLALVFEKLFTGVYYLGPLREYPQPSYAWSGNRPQDVGRRGEDAIAALLASQTFGKIIPRGQGKENQTVAECVAEWLQKLGLIESFQLKRIVEHRQEYEVRVKVSANASDVLITNVGFGVSQILPVLVLCYYAPEGSTLIFEQPEIHLHPSVQAGLADVFIDVIKTRNMQIVLESHSEHLLRRLQRRIAEEQLQADQTALYFATFAEGESKLEQLQMDLFGNITNWPPNFFGDEMGDLVAMTEATINRELAGKP